MNGVIAQVEANGWTVRMMPGDIGYAAVRGSEVHFAAIDRLKAIQRNALRTFSQALEDEFGFLTTRVSETDEANQRFVRLMGFTETWTDESYRYYMQTALPFERKQKCPC